ncbi:OLC1v1013367C1 [Oldenlandia corymbosa var. corymbosa]|uniref:OLC1v1013367C1 n=1 Tax=Oldenlandia corymbosa var. corymbosa TaxID=529605 RepID=A0AAV1E0M1_OLDCO|nr:OLC1v1013367C1 [Oldenlandia corymbosa var. corymbosa]
MPEVLILCSPKVIEGSTSGLATMEKIAIPVDVSVSPPLPIITQHIELEAAAETEKSPPTQRVSDPLQCDSLIVDADNHSPTTDVSSDGAYSSPEVEIRREWSSLPCHQTS